jgi:antitoxin VapB
MGGVITIDLDLVSTRAGGLAMRAKLFRNGRSQAVRLPAAFRFEGTEVEIHRDPESGVVVLTPVRPSASALLELRDALLQEPGFEADYITSRQI